MIGAEYAVVHGRIFPCYCFSHSYNNLSCSGEEKQVFRNLPQDRGAHYGQWCDLLLSYCVDQP